MPLDSRNVATLLIRIFHKPKILDFKPHCVALTYTYIGADKKMPDGSWRERKRVKLFLKSSSKSSFESMKNLEQWDYVYAEGYLGSWNTATTYGIKADACLVVTAITRVPLEEADRRFAAAKETNENPVDTPITA